MKAAQVIPIIIGLLFISSISAVNTVYAEEQGKVIFKEGFDNGLKGWNINESSVEVVKTPELNKYVKISRDNRRGFTYIGREFMGAKGTLIFEANIKFDNIVPGNKNFHRGKFQAVVVVDGREVDWPDDDFEGSSPWMPRKIKVFDLTGKETVVLRIGLQNAKGIVYIDDVKVTNIP